LATERQQNGVTLRPPIKGRIPPINGSTLVALYQWNLLERQKPGIPLIKGIATPVVERILDLVTRHIPESTGQQAVTADLPIYLAAVILHVQRINLGMDTGVGQSCESMVDYLIGALRSFGGDR
jgi:hypothetical protein